MLLWSQQDSDPGKYTQRETVGKQVLCGSSTQLCEGLPQIAWIPIKAWLVCPGGLSLCFTSSKSLTQFTAVVVIANVEKLLNYLPNDTESFSSTIWTKAIQNNPLPDFTHSKIICIRDLQHFKFLQWKVFSPRVCIAWHCKVSFLLTWHFQLNLKN